MKFNRKLLLRRYLQKGRSVLLLGPRGTGKTTWIKHLLHDEANQLSFDLLDSATYQKYLKAPQQLGKEIAYRVQRETASPLLVFIDEVQRVPELLNEVHRLIELYKNRVCFALSGSSARKLRRGGANLLAGRALIFYLFPLNHTEIDQHYDLTRALQFGLLPEVVKEEDSELCRLYLQSYCHSYLREEIKEEALLRNVEGFSRFLDVAAQYNGQCVNYSKIARLVGLSPTAVRNYYEILDDTLIATRIDGYTFSKLKQLQKAPKYYFFDTGVLNAFTGELQATPKPSTYRYGKLFETLIIHELRSEMSYQQNTTPWYHYRTSTGQEIDLILQRNPKTAPLAIEIKSANTPTVKDVKTLIKFRAEHLNARCVVLCTTRTPYHDDGIDFLPWKQGIESLSQIQPES